MSEKVVFTVVMPLMEVKDTALIAISTPLKKTNFYSELCSLEDANGDPVFNVLDINLKCDRCDMKNALKRKVPRVCKHILNRLPPWKDAEKHELVKLIFEQVGRGGDYDRESRGMISDDGDAAFDSQWIDSLERRSTYKSMFSPRFILLTCDPNGGGISSDTSLFSSYYENGKMIICGIDTHETKRDQKRLFLRSHIQALRNIPRFKDAWIVFLPENNMGDGARILFEEAEKKEKVHIYLDEKLNEGALTQAGTKMRYTERAIDFLCAENAIYFDKDLVCANPYKNSESRLTETKKEYIKQLRQWRKIVYLDKMVKSKPSVICTGKSDDTGKRVQGQKDDICIAFLMAAYFIIEIQRNRGQFPKSMFE